MTTKQMKRTQFGLVLDMNETGARINKTQMKKKIRKTAPQQSEKAARADERVNQWHRKTFIQASVYGALFRHKYNTYNQ